MAVRFYRSFSLRINDYAPQMIVKTPSPCHVLATQNSAAQTPIGLKLRVQPKDFPRTSINGNAKRAPIGCGWFKFVERGCVGSHDFVSHTNDGCRDHFFSSKV